ncbi:hypothetical protein [Pseudoalteromonas sp. SR45-4]|uniref:hypothetical protein n=1 Tax=Pseudoalteromonas sp. SR45-4 TaxID=2760929 RepID=UPI0015FD0388|nr:hypothetical protein [Pseudoalteromonas sp. SR45-4]MBB1371966.1 hypothetical protein [Pseudoalteromonas sp. SR45-4]
MPIKKSVRLVDCTIKLCNELTTPSEAREGVNWSGSLNAMAEQYKIFATEALPELTDNQRAAFHCAYNGYIAPPNLEQEIDMLPWNIEQGYQYDSQIRDLLGSEEVAVTFISEIKEWSKAQKLAVIYMARAYWRQGPIVE